MVRFCSGRPLSANQPLHVYRELPTDTLAVQVVTATGSPRQLAVQQLVNATGSPWQFCARALEKCGNDPQRALDWIVQNRQRLIAHCNSCIDPACQTCQKVRAFLAQQQEQQQQQQQRP